MENAILLTADLIRHRDRIRVLFGRRWQAEILPYRTILREHANGSGKSLAETALAMAKKMDTAGLDPSMPLAAFVEECEAENVP